LVIDPRAAIWLAARLDGELRRSRRDRCGAGYVTDTQLPAAPVVERSDACFIVRCRSGQAFAYVYFDDEKGRRAAAKLRCR
jgi:hypothetical protein